MSRILSPYRSADGKTDVRRCIGDFGFLLLLCVYPVLLTDGYYDIMKIRITFFSIVSVTAFFLCITADLFQRRRGFPARRAQTSVPVNTALLLCAFTVIGFFSVFFSQAPTDALTGESGRYMGALSYAVICFAFLFIRKYSRFGRRILYPFGAVVIAAVVIGYLQFVGLDLLNLLRGLTAAGRKNFISLFGNINVFSSFLCMAAPVFMHTYCVGGQEDRFFSLLTGGFCFLGLFIANSDSGYIGFYAAFALIAILASADSSEALKRYLHLPAVFFATGILFSLFCRAGGSAVRTASKLTSAMTGGVLPFAALAVFVLLCVLLRRRDFSAAARKKICIAVGCLFLLTVLAVAVGILVFTFLLPDADIGYLSRYLRFNDMWGTGRGGIWRLMMNMFRELPIEQKLFGIGADTIGIRTWEMYRLEMYRVTGSYIDNAHNEYMQYLLTHGILGLGCYLGFLVYGIAGTLRAKHMPAYSRAFAAAAFCYAAQATVNILQSITTPLLFVCIAAAQSGFYTDAPAEADGDPQTAEGEPQETETNPQTAAYDPPEAEAAAQETEGEEKHETNET